HTGRGTLEVPHGRYEVLVSHGPEWEVARESVDVEHRDAATLHAVLRHVVETPGWLACDFHLHAAPSDDSGVSLTDRVASLLTEGVELAVASDHDHVTSYERALGDL